ncbi:unnamed protein product [Ranitomeya imitator]|uniref:Reverse transcriptase domain-containing protein n=1 Tax=Ranitomeya imitator TaxID=111125 RepID=A0ABN9KS46_9NEOB|nr:unnamed protein product [Ranitomeya imitator]
MALHRLIQKTQNISKKLQLYLQQLGQRLRSLPGIFFRRTSCSYISRKTRRGRRKHGLTENDHAITSREVSPSNNIVYNISSQNLSSTDMTLLQKGLTFCPVPHFDTFQVDQELHRFFRTLRLKVHFSNTPFETTPDLTKTSSGFSLKSLGLRTSSSFQPPKTYHPVETFIEVVNRDVKEILGSIDKGLVKVKNNLSREEYRSLMDLKNNRNLIIKPADKGGAIVVLDRTYYINEILSQLNDTNTYMPVSNNPTFEIGRQISNLVSHYLSLGVIDQKLGDFLINHHPVIPVLYTLPKIHKDLLRPPGRPIVASTNSVLSPLAITVEKILSPLVPFMKSYLKDTTHFLQLLRDLGPLPSNSILVTMDVSSLYTNIDHQEGLESVTKYVTTYANFSDNQLQFCIDALTIILTKNYFLFEDQFYVQKKGTAMGSNVAPPFANIFMDFYETSYVYCHPLFSSNVIFWRRFIDDVFFIWTGDAEALRGFHADLNSSTPNITFSLQYSDQSINFLDTLVIIRSGGIVETDLNVKSTDRNSLLSYTGNHPRHVKKALPKSQHDRIRRIVSNPVQRTMRYMEMDRKFHDRGYPPTLDGNIGAQIINLTATPKQPRIAFVRGRNDAYSVRGALCLISQCRETPGPDAGSCKQRGAALNLMDLEFARRCGFSLQPLQSPIPLRGIDATPLAKDKPQYWTQITMYMAPPHQEDCRFLVLHNLHDVVVLSDVPLVSISSSPSSEVPEFLSDFQDVFDEPKFSSLPPHRDCDCAINLIPG